MKKSPVGLSALYESLRLEEEQSQESDFLLEAMGGSMLVDDEVKAALIGEDSVEGDMDSEDMDPDEVSKLEDVLNRIVEDDDEEDIDNILESFIIEE